MKMIMTAILARPALHAHQAHVQPVVTEPPGQPEMLIEEISL
jgi:hypothetical protein